MEREVVGTVNEGVSVVICVITGTNVRVIDELTALAVAGDTARIRVAARGAVFAGGTLPRTTRSPHL